MIRGEEVYKTNMENTKIAIKAQIREERVNYIRNKVSACMHYLYIHILFVTLVKLFEILWNET